MAEKARAGKLAPNEFQGGTFRHVIFYPFVIAFGKSCTAVDIWMFWHCFCSISNLGMYPVDHFCAIINPPQVPTSYPSMKWDPWICADNCYCHFSQSGILAVGRGNKIIEPVVDSDGTFPWPCVIPSKKQMLLYFNSYWYVHLFRNREGYSGYKNELDIVRWPSCIWWSSRRYWYP